MEVMQARFDTSSVARGEAIDYWRDAVCQNLNGITCQSADDVRFYGKLAATLSDVHVVARLSGGRHQAIRTELARRQMGDHFYILFYQLDGTMGVESSGDEFEVGPREFYFYDSRNNHRLLFQSNFNHIAIRLPRARVRERWGGLSQMGSFHYAAKENPMAALIGSNIRALAAVSAELSRPQLDVAVDNVMELFDANIHERDRPVPEATPGQARTIHARAHAYIEQRLADEGLCAETIAGHLGISRRYLDKVFHMRGETIAGSVRTLRLHKCARELEAPFARDRAVAQTAYAWGFRNAAHFSKSFRREFGLTPTEYKAARMRFPA